MRLPWSVVTWQHVAALSLACGLAITGAILNSEAALAPIATTIIGGVLGHAMAQPRLSHRSTDAPGTTFKQERLAAEPGAGRVTGTGHQDAGAGRAGGPIVAVGPAGPLETAGPGLALVLEGTGGTGAPRACPHTHPGRGQGARQTAFLACRAARAGGRPEVAGRVLGRGAVRKPARGRAVGCVGAGVQLGRGAVQLGPGIGWGRSDGETGRQEEGEGGEPHERTTSHTNAPRQAPTDSQKRAAPRVGRMERAA